MSAKSRDRSGSSKSRSYTTKGPGVMPYFKMRRNYNAAERQLIDAGNVTGATVLFKRRVRGQS